jgi:paraquat-inducible protein A
MTSPERPDSRGRDPVTGALLLAAAPLLAAGLTMPAVSIRRLAFFEDTYSLLEGILAFWSRGDALLFLLLLAFSVVFPALKIVASVLAWFLADSRPAMLARLIALLAALSRWSMLDVFIVAITVLVADGRLLASADVHAGILLFAGAAIASTAATHRLARGARRDA